MDEAIARYPASNASAAMPLLHLWQEHFGFINDEASLDRGETRSATDQYSRAGHFLSDVSPAAGRQNAHSRLPHPELRNGRQLSGNGRFVRGDRNPAPTDGEEMHNPIAVSANGNYSIEFVECLASCGTAPVCMVNDDLHENVHPDIRGEPFKQAKSPIRHSQRRTRVRRSFSLPPHPLERRLVFKNIGRHDWTTDIDCYLSAGGYEHLRKRYDVARRHRQRSQNLGPARPRRRRIFLRREMELYQAGRKATGLFDLQRRRIRAGHV